jgi:hypothetical protein
MNRREWYFLSRRLDHVVGGGSKIPEGTMAPLATSEYAVPSEKIERQAGWVKFCKCLSRLLKSRT